MALLAGQFGVTTVAGASESSSSSSSSALRQSAVELVRIGISAPRPCTSIVAASKCLMTVPSGFVRSTRCRAVATNFLEEEPEVLEINKEVSEKEKEKEKEEEEEVSPLTPSAFEVQNLLMQVCDETSNIAEVQLKVGSFSLRVRREIGKPAPAPKPVAPGPPVLGKAMVESIPAQSVPAAPPKPTKISKLSKLSITPSRPISNFSLMEDAADAGILFITSPKVGLFRKGRTVKGKGGPPLCEEGQVIQKGKVVCYLEQLGTQQPVEADITGEVEKILWEDGEPVGYGDPLIAIRPSFPGIKVKGQLSG